MDGRKRFFFVKKIYIYIQNHLYIYIPLLYLIEILHKNMPWKVHYNLQDCSEYFLWWAFGWCISSFAFWKRKIMYKAQLTKCITLWGRQAINFPLYYYKLHKIKLKKKTIYCKNRNAIKLIRNVFPANAATCRLFTFPILVF